MVDSISSKTILVVSDTAHQQLPTSWHKSTVGCRSGLQCDLQAVDAIYRSSSCQHAVLTSMSTFGNCISGLGEIKDVWIVRPDGACVRKEHIDPIGAGTSLV